MTERWLIMLAATLICASGCATTADRRGSITQCPVHQQLLLEDTIRIAYGIPPYDRALIDAQLTQFPHARSKTNGPCVVFPDSPRRAVVLYCPTCRQAEEMWREQHETASE